VIPVTRTVLADGVTPVALFEALCGERSGTFLFESAEQGRSWSRYSFVGVRCAAMLTERDSAAQWAGRVPVGLPLEGEPDDVLRATVAALRTARLEGLPPFTGGMVGYLTYDAVRRWESVPDRCDDDLRLPELGFLLATDLAVLDHWSGTVTLIANAINFDASDERVEAAWADAVGRLDAMQARLASSMGGGVATWDVIDDEPPQSTFTRAEYCAAVERIQDHIRRGDVFQVVLSQRFTVPYAGRALDIYRVLRSTNPSPYMYLLRVPVVGHSGELTEAVHFDIVGSSPEALVTVTDGECVVHPIAGTRPRAASTDEDASRAMELLQDTKERAEHVMLVDLARNDLGRVCIPGTVHVTEFMEVERYSHVMHLVSTVVGTMDPRSSAFDALVAAFPAGTLSGAPKPRAMAIIDDCEPTRRGVYGGCVGYIDFAGNMDMAIAIRTAVITGGQAYVQAGAGVVADSRPDSEFDECVAKARAVVRAVRTAATLRSTDGADD
jgi:anthranilate synthase component 1